MDVEPVKGCERLHFLFFRTGHYDSVSNAPKSKSASQREPNEGPKKKIKKNRMWNFQAWHLRLGPWECFEILP